MPTRLGLFYAWTLRYCVNCILIQAFFADLFLKVFFFLLIVKTVILNLCSHIYDFHYLNLKVGWGCTIERGKTPPHNECPGYGTKQSDGEV